MASEISRPQISASGSASLKMRAKRPFAAAHVEDAPAAQIAEVLPHQLHVPDARVDGGGEALLVAGGLIE